MKSLIIGFLFLSLNLHAQIDRDSLHWGQKLARDMVDNVIDNDAPRSPLKATVFSAIIPGAGQIYNRQYYKLHLVYGGIGGMLYAIDFNKTQFDRFDVAFRQRLDNQPSEFPDSVPTQAIENARDQYRKNLDLSYIGMGFVYIFNVADAFVSAHLSTFDVSDDLSFHLEPVSEMIPSGSNMVGLGLVMTF